MEQITLSVEPKRWAFTVSRRRQDERGGQRELRTLGRWVERYRRRSRDTATRDPEIEYTDGIADYFIRNLGLYRVTLRRIVNGQDYGLPATLMTDAGAVAFEAVDGRYFDRLDFWEGALGRR